MSSPRKRGPILRGGCCFEPSPTTSLTTRICGYGPRRSPGRRLTRLATFTPPTLYAASAAVRRPAYRGFIFLIIRARMLAERSVPSSFAPDIKEVHDGQPHAILYRWRLGRSRRQEIHARRQPGDRRGDV